MKHCLGAGGFGEVYLADRTTDDGGTEEVAVKVLHSGLDPRSQAVQRLADEAKLLKLLQHPNVLACDDLLTLEGRVTLVSEYLDGADFDVILDGAERIPLPAGLEVLARVAEVLQTAWSTLGPNGTPLKLLHRDIKPSNLLLTT